MLTKKELKHFYPHLITRILLFLRQQQYFKPTLLTEDIITKFNKSKSRISQALSFLTKRGYVERAYVPNIKHNGSRHKISLTPKGLEVASVVLSEGLDPLEQEVIKALEIRSI